MTTRNNGDCSLNDDNNRSYHGGHQKRSRNERSDSQPKLRDHGYMMQTSMPQLEPRWTPPLSDPWLALGSRWESPPSYYSLVSQCFHQNSRGNRPNNYMSFALNSKPQVDGVSQHLKQVSPSPTKDIVHTSEVHDFCFEDDFFSGDDYPSSLAYADDTNPLYVINPCDTALNEDPITLPPFFETTKDADCEKSSTDQNLGCAYHEFQCEMSYSSKEQIIRGELSSYPQLALSGFQLTRSFGPGELISEDIPKGGYYKGFFSVLIDGSDRNNSHKEQSKMFTCERVHLEFQCVEEDEATFDVKGFGGISLGAFTISGEGSPIRKGGTTVGFDLSIHITCKSFKMH